MQWFKKASIIATILFLSYSLAYAADFNWAAALNVQSRDNPLRYASDLDARFRMGEAKVQGILKMVKEPADAYMVLRFAEMSSRSPEYVLERYNTHKSQGWGSLAKSLGIKPGSAEFKALKNGHDLYSYNDRDKHAKKNNGNKHKKDKD